MRGALVSYVVHVLMMTWDVNALRFGFSVSSGKECMAFSWENDQLFFRRDTMESSVEWTTTLMNTREPMKVSNTIEMNYLSLLGFVFNRRLIFSITDPKF